MAVTGMRRLIPRLNLSILIFLTILSNHQALGSPLTFFSRLWLDSHPPFMPEPEAEVEGRADELTDREKVQAAFMQLIIIGIIASLIPLCFLFSIFCPPMSVILGVCRRIARHIDDRDYYKYNNASTAMRIEREKQLEQQKMSAEMEEKRYVKLNEDMKKRDDEAKNRRLTRRAKGRSWMDENLMREARYIHPIDDFSATAKEKRDVKFVKTAIRPTADAYELHHDVDAQQYIQIVMMGSLVVTLLALAKIYSTPAFMAG